MAFKGGRINVARSLPDDPEEFRATLVEHLDELRTRIVRIVAMLVVGWVAGWFLQPYLYVALETNMMKHVNMEYQIAFPNVGDAFFLVLKLSFTIGLILTGPFIVLQLWGFVAPGLTPRERKPIKIMAPISVALFALGAFFAWLILPACLRFFADFFDMFQGVSLIQQPGLLISFCLKMMLAFGVGFQLPLIVFVLAITGLVSSDTFLSNWRQAIVIIFAASAFLTPSGDAISLSMMAVPLSILFLGSLGVVKIVEKRRAKEEALEAERLASIDADDEPSIERDDDLTPAS